MKYEAMDEDDMQSSSIMIPTALAVLAIVLGAAALYFGFNANKRLGSIGTSIEESSTNAAETEKTVVSFDARIAELETKISDQSRVINRLRSYISQSEQKLVKELNASRDQIQKTARELNEIKAGRVRTNTSSDRTDEVPFETVGVVDKSPTKSVAERTYIIVSGDTFGKVASRFDVPLQAILDANPDADPRRLRIGQKIVIPLN